jgi:predicted lipid-binding transport protein (Tim44 family)
MQQGTVLMAVYDDAEQAERAIDELRRFDFRDDQIGLVVCGQPLPPADAGPPPRPASAPSAPAVGAMLGGVVGALAAIGLPGLGTVLAGGILAGLLEGVAAGGLVGVLVKLGVPEAQAHAYGEAVELGRALVVVRAEDRVEEADDILQAYRPYQVERGDRAEPPVCD